MLHNVDLASICHFLVLDPHLKGHRSNLWLSSNRITLFHWTLDPHLKWPKEHKVTIKTHKYEQDYTSEAWQFFVVGVVNAISIRQTS